MRDDFLTIPNFPKYEINSKFQVRNKTTGIILTNHRKKHASYVTLYSEKGHTDRNVTRLRKLAVEATFIKEEYWLPVPSLNGRYELSKYGNLRNSRTLNHCKKYLRCNQFYFQVLTDKGNIWVSLRSLLWEVYGEEYTPQNVRIPVTLKKDYMRAYFDTKRAAAKFLSNKTRYSFGWIIQRLLCDGAVIDGWKVTLHRPIARS